MRKVVVVTLVERFSEPPPDQDHLDQVQEGHCQNEQRNQDRPMARMTGAVEMWKNGQDGEEVANKMAAGIAKEGARVGKVIGKETEQRAERQKGNDADEVLAIGSSDHPEIPGANCAQAGAKAVHIVHEIEGVNNSKNPQDGNGVMENRVLDEE